MTLTEAQRGNLIDDIQNNVDFSYNGWSPSLNVWRAKESHKVDLPFVVVDFLPTSRKKFASLGDIIGRIDDLHYQFGYCELEVVNVSVHANKYHNDRNILGRDFCNDTLLKIRRRILAFWNDILKPYGASLERGININIRDLSNYKPDVGTRYYEYDMDVYLRTDVRWDTRESEDQDLTVERAEKAYIILQDKNNIRVVYNG